MNPAESFAVGRDEIPHAVRVCLGAVQERAKLEEGLFGAETEYLPDLQVPVDRVL